MVFYSSNKLLCKGLRTMLGYADARSRFGPRIWTCRLSLFIAEFIHVGSGLLFKLLALHARDGRATRFVILI